MLSKSKDHNPNYLAKVIELKGLHKHPNADRLQVVSIDFQNVITGPDAKDGDIYVFFPLECKINTNFLSATNAFRDKELNADKEQVGFFENKGRVRAVKLRGEKSMGYIVPYHVVSDFTQERIGEPLTIGEEFDTMNGVLMCEKYQVPVKQGTQRSLGKKPRISRLVDGQVRLHVDTENLRKNMYKIEPQHNVSITYKLHGTSFWVANVLTKRKLNIVERLLKKLGVAIKDQEYDYVYGSRKVVKNEYETQKTQDYYGGDMWGTIKDELKEFVPKGYTFYGECVGYTKGGEAIQSKYDYGCLQHFHKNYIYRITFTNADGLVRELSNAEIERWANNAGFEFVPLIYTGTLQDLYPDIGLEEHWHENVMKKLEELYEGKDCYMCKNVVPAEGIVLRKESGTEFEAYKLKSFKFLEYETALLDAGVEDMESQSV